MKKLILLLLTSIFIFSGCFLIPFDVTIETKPREIGFYKIRIKDAKFDGTALPSEGETIVRVGGGERILSWTAYKPDGSEEDFSETYTVSGNIHIIVIGDYATME